MAWVWKPKPFPPGDPNDQLFQDAGVKFVRIGLPWWYIEQTQGVYNFNDAVRNYDSTVNDFAARGIRVIYDPIWLRQQSTLRLRHGSRHGGIPARLQQFLRGGGRRYKGKGVLFELWNEPNSDYWPGGENVDQYMALVNQAVPAIRGADSNATIIGAATCPPAPGSIRPS